MQKVRILYYQSNKTVMVFSMASTGGHVERCDSRVTKTVSLQLGHWPDELKHDTSEAFP